MKPVLLLALCSFAAAPTQLRRDLDYLCSSELEGRLSLTPAADKAAAYIARQFAGAGLQPGNGKEFLQPFPLIAYDPDRARTRLTIIRHGTRTALESPHDFRGGFWKELTRTAPVVFAGYGITAPEYQYDDYAGVDVRGKIVLIFDHEPQENDPHSRFNGTGHTRYGASRAKLENARRHGAAALLVVSDPLRKHPGTFDPPRPAGLRASAPRQALDEDTIPLFQISDSTAATLLWQPPAEIAKAIDAALHPASRLLVDTQIEFATAPANLRRATSANVVGLLAGSDPTLRAETIVIDAHYDHLGIHNGRVYPGANDNASGTAGVMELARRFARSPSRPARSILFIVFGSEEEIMLGSFYYVAHPLRPLATTRAVLNLDMIARDEAHIPQSEGVVEIPADTRNEINLVGTFYSPDLAAAIEKANAVSKLDISTKFDRDHDLNALFRCDHLPFLQHDIPAVWIFGGWHPGYHEPSDTVDRLNFTKLEKVLTLTGETARSLANAPGYPRFRAAPQP